MEEKVLKKLCFTTYVYGTYQDYIPIYIFALQKAFPQHFVKIFVQDVLRKNNRKALKLLEGNFEVIDNFREFNKCKIPHLAANRFLLTREYFEEFDYIYFGDVDFINYNEHDDQFYDTYVAHCNATGLPFSNEWNYDWGRYRMTGLHFVIKDPYFDAMDPFIYEMRDPEGNFFRKQCRHSSKYPSYDEEMLYYMACQAFDLRPLNNYRRPFHGLHFGTFRILSPEDPFVRNQEHESDGRNNFDQWKGKDWTKLQNVLEDPLFPTLVEFCEKETKDVIKRTLHKLYKKMFL